MDRNVLEDVSFLREHLLSSKCIPISVIATNSGHDKRHFTKVHVKFRVLSSYRPIIYGHTRANTGTAYIESKIH